jgi:hypothetical protein
MASVSLGKTDKEISYSVMVRIDALVLTNKQIHPNSFIGANNDKGTSFLSR